ncbi:hypothetical protein LCGC14_1583210 [marine sediment metagenome]|uniref:Uncharacterized protein n=1 Tax=marine sediment metagenome TaxID=412755 RepID=A0A0F9J2G9_9ZZZZ
MKAMEMSCRVEGCSEPVYGSIPMKVFLKVDDAGVYFNDKLVIIDIEPWYYCSWHYELLGGINKIIDGFVSGIETEIITIKEEEKK